MLGAIAGDIIGSTREFAPVLHKVFELLPEDSFPTDDTLLTIEIARWILDGGDLVDAFHACVENHPDGGWGERFMYWADAKQRAPYNSFGNGSAMRVSPVGWAFDSAASVLEAAERSAAITHNHPEGIKGAQAVALAVFMGRTGASKGAIRDELTSRFGYALRATIDELRPHSRFDETCQGSVPQAIVAFLDSTDWEDAVRNAVSLGADADTQACIAGGIAEAFYDGVPESVREFAFSLLDADARSIVERFEARCMPAA